MADKETKIEINLLKAAGWLNAIQTLDEKKEPTVNLDILDLFNVYATVALQADMAARYVNNQNIDLKNGVYPYPVGDPIKGDLSIAVSASTNNLRWLVDNVHPPTPAAESFLVGPVVPPGQAAKLRELGAPQIGLIILAVGALASAAAAVAYWAGKREDRMSNVDTTRIKTEAGVSAAIKIAQEQIAKGQKPSAKILDFLKDSGGSSEDRRGWGVPVTAGVIGVTVGGGLVYGGMKHVGG